MSVESSSEPQVAVVVTGEPIAAAHTRYGGFDALIERAAEPVRARFVALDARERLPELSGFDAVVVTGSAASVTDRASWMLATEARLAAAVRAGVAVLGICFGHQLLAQALGGRVARNPRGREIGSVRLEQVAPDPLLGAHGDTAEVNMTHVDSVVELPPGAELIGRTALDPHAMLRFSPHAWGVQFHPELDREVLVAYVDGRSEAIASEGLDPAVIRAGVGDAAAGREVLRRFLLGVAAGGFER